MRELRIGLGLFLPLLIGSARADDKPPKPRLFVVAIAIDAYPEAFGFPEFERKGALARSAKALVDKLAKKSDDGVFGQATVHMLANDKATAEAIVGALRAVAEAATPEDVFVLYFAGAVVGTPVEIDLPALKQNHAELVSTLERLSVQKVDGEAKRDLVEQQRAIGDEIHALDEAIGRGERIVDLQKGLQEMAEHRDQTIRAMEELTPEEQEAAAESVEREFEALQEEGARMEDEITGLQEMIVRFVQFDTDPEQLDSAMPHLWLAEALGVIPCASQLVVLDGFLDERALDRTNVIDVLLNEPHQELREWMDVRRMLVLPGAGARETYPHTRDLVTQSVLRCLTPAGDLDESGVVSAAEVRAGVAAESYRILAKSKDVELVRAAGDLTPRTFIIGHNFPLHAVGKIVRGAESTRGVGGATARSAKKQKADPNRPRQDHALLIAIDDYDEWKDLHNPVFDATHLKSTLEGEYGFQVELVKNPTWKQIVATLKKYQAKQFGPYDQLLVFFAGHGHYVGMFGSGYIIPKNASLPSADAPRPARALQHTELRFLVGKIPCRHTLLILDSCFSGAFGQLASDAGHRGAGTYAELKGDELIRRRLKYKARHYLTSGGKEYVPDGEREKHSPFARLLLGGLRDAAARQKTIDFQWLASHVSVTKATEPRAGSFGGEPGSTFLFVPK